MSLSKIETTEIYTHATGGASLVSPLDQPATVIPFPVATAPKQKHA